jgi:hypothetical protein
MVQENQRCQVVKKTMWKHNKSYCALLLRTEKFPLRLKCSVMSRIGCGNLEDDNKYLDEGTFDAL